MTRPDGVEDSLAVRVVTVGAVLLVATVAAVVSYAHMQEVAARSGEAWRSYLVPLSVDGLVIAASMVLLTRHRAGEPGGWLPWAALLGAVGASLAANVAAAEPAATARLVAAWPPGAFAVAFELLLSQRRPAGVPAAAPHLVTDPVDQRPGAAGEQVTDRVGHQPPATRETVADPAPAVTTAMSAPAVTQHPPAPAPVRQRERSPGRERERSPAGVGGEGDLTRRVRELLAVGGVRGRAPGRRALARELDVSEHEARRLLAATNGTGGGR